MNSTEWHAYFQQNRHDRVPIAWDAPVRPPATGRAAIVRSLGCFQLGESSDGRRLSRLAHETGDTSYAAAIELLIGEEQEHSRLLGKVLDRLAAPRLRLHWSDWLFRRCRHVLGFHEEILVLLMAEIAALKYYSIISRGTADQALQRVCEQILHDEKFHVRFHCEYLHRWLTRRAPVIQRSVWWALTGMFAGASTVVAWDHRDAFLALGSSAEEFLDDSWQNFGAARQAIFTGTAFVWSRTLGRVESPAQLPAHRSQLELAWALCRRSWRALSYQRPVVGLPGYR